MGTEAVIVDLDGSLVDMSPVVHLVRRKPKNFEEFYRYGVEDAAPNEAIMSRVWRHATLGREPIYLTGRPYRLLAGTSEWLLRNNAPWGLLFMRPDGDHRPDVVVKKEIYERDIAPIFNVVEAIEDRARVAAMWESLGIPVHLVPGWEE